MSISTVRYFVYMMSNTHNTVLYTGSTDNLTRRVGEHKEKSNPKSFTARMNCNKLVYLEEHPTFEAAVKREYQLKRYKRKWKNDLIEVENPDWKDLADIWE
jgi:putative endonuclease